MYLPPSHLKAMDPDNILVTGMRGAGKTFWWAALQEPAVRDLIFQASSHASTLGEDTEVRTGFSVRNQAPYYRHLLEVTTRQDWEAWILFMLEAVRTAAAWTTAKIGAIRDLLDETGAAIRQRAPKIYSRELVELIFVHPYCRISDVVAADIAKRQTAAVYLNALAARGVLNRIKAGRENLYINPPLLALLAGRA